MRKLVTISIQRAHFDAIIAHAREAEPLECCGLIGGTERMSQTTYRARNIAANPVIAYEAAPEDLFRAQRSMRGRGEQLLAIYHSHPRSKDPVPSETDVRLAYYPSAVYFIVGLGGDEPVLRAFRISERDGNWQTAEYEITGPAST